MKVKEHVTSHESLAMAILTSMDSKQLAYIAHDLVLVQDEQYL